MLVRCSASVCSEAISYSDPVSVCPVFATVLCPCVLVPIGVVSAVRSVRSTRSLSFVSTIAADPTKPGNYWVATGQSIQYCAGPGTGAGTGIQTIQTSTANSIETFVVTSTGKQLWLLSGLVLSVVDVTDNSSSTRGCIRFDHLPHQLCIYRSPTAERDRILFITCEDGLIHRFDSQTSTLTSLPSGDGTLDPLAISCTPNGTLLVTCCFGCAVFAIDAVSGEMQQIAKIEKARQLRSTHIIETNDRFGLVICDAGGFALRYVTLSPHLFVTT